MEKPTDHAPKLIQIPEDTLLCLLEKAGQDPAEFFNVQNARVAMGTAYQKRANAAVWSILWLSLSTLFSAVSFLTGFDPEDIIAAVLLGGMTIMEIKVRGWFLAGDPNGARFGYWNQSLFACLFLVYGAYHYNAGSVSPEVAQAIGPYSDTFLWVSKATYASIGVIGAAGQYWLARYYKRCR
jgi:hypothetical protein